jgi:hypothetical protein
MLIPGGYQMGITFLYDKKYTLLNTLLVPTGYHN